MRFCESVRGQRGQRGQGGAGAFRAAVAVLLLSLAQSAPPQTACPAAVAPKSLNQSQYQHTAEEDTSVGFMAALVQSFLHTVQPYPFPQGQCHQCISHSSNTEYFFMFWSI